MHNIRSQIVHVVELDKFVYFLEQKIKAKIAPCIENRSS